MNGVTASLNEIETLKQHLKAEPANCDVMICPPATLVMACAEAAAGSPIQVGGQEEDIRNPIVQERRDIATCVLVAIGVPEDIHVCIRRRTLIAGLNPERPWRLGEPCSRIAEECQAKDCSHREADSVPQAVHARTSSRSH